MLVYDVKLNFESAHMLLIVVLYFFSCQIRAWCRESSWIYERVQNNKWWFKLLEHTIEYFAIDFGYTIFTFSCLHIIPSLLEQLLHSCVIRCCLFPIPLHPFNHSFIYVINIWSKVLITPVWRASPCIYTFEAFQHIRLIHILDRRFFLFVKYW